MRVGQRGVGAVGEMRVILVISVLAPGPGSTPGRPHSLELDVSGPSSVGRVLWGRRRQPGLFCDKVCLKHVCAGPAARVRDNGPLAGHGDGWGVEVCSPAVVDERPVFVGCDPGNTLCPVRVEPVERERAVDVVPRAGNPPRVERDLHDARSDDRALGGGAGVLSRGKEQRGSDLVVRNDAHPHKLLPRVPRRRVGPIRIHSGRSNSPPPHPHPVERNQRNNHTQNENQKPCCHRHVDRPCVSSRGGIVVVVSVIDITRVSRRVSRA